MKMTLTMPEVKDSSQPGRPLRILLVEDSPRDAKLTIAALQHSNYKLSVDTVDTLAAFRDQLERSDHDVILSDYNLRDWTALEALQALKNSGKDIPLIVVTGTTDDETAVEVINQGATDYLVKGHLGRLPSAIQRALDEKAARQARMESAKALRKSEATFRSFVEFAADAIVLVDQQGHITLVNAQAEKLFGYKREELIGKQVELLVPKGGAGTYADLPDEYEENPRPRTIGSGLAGVSALHKDGHEIPVEIALAPVETPEGRLIISTIRDISERRRAEFNLRAREHQQQVVAELGLYALSEPELPELMQRAAQLVAKTLELETTSVLEMQPDRKTLLIRAGVGWKANVIGQATVEAGTGSMAGYCFIHDGPVVSEDVRSESKYRATKLLLDHGVVSGMCVMIQGARSPYGVLAAHSSSQRKFTQTEIHFLQGVANLLAESVRRHESGTELTKIREMLSQSQKMEAIGRLAGGIAHDFNNHLGIIIGYSEMLMEKLGSENPLSKRARTIHETGKKAAALTKQLLAFSRKQIFEPRIADLNEIASELEKMLRPLIGENIELVTTLAPDIGKVRVDPAQVDQVLMNLAVNARDAMPEGGRLIIETKNAELDEAYARGHIAVRPGSYIMLAVSDTGTGMDQETQSRIFEPFFTTKEKGKGTGLGLSMVYGIIKQSGGNIWVYSEPGHGTTFKIYLPRAEASDQPVNTATAPTQEMGEGTVLVAEDVQALRELTSEFLTDCGYTVLAAESGATAIEMAGRCSEPIDLLVTDAVMPGMSGRELATQLQVTQPDMKVLFVSGYTDDAVLRSGMLRPDMEFLQKPFTRDQLLRKVRKVLGAEVAG